MFEEILIIKCFKNSKNNKANPNELVKKIRIHFRIEKKEITYEYQYKDITSVKVVENTEEIINAVGQFFRKSCKFEICVPGDSLSCTFRNNDEQVNSVKAMKAVIRDKKNQ